MVMSIGEQIQALEEAKTKLKGPGSIAKKEEIQSQIDELKRQDGQTEKEAEKSAAVSAPIVRASKGSPIPAYRKATLEEIQAAEKAGKLCGVDYKAMTASIKD